MQLFTHGDAAGQIRVEALRQLLDALITHAITLGLLLQGALLMLGEEGPEVCRFLSRKRLAALAGETGEVYRCRQRAGLEG